jgi:hypothetical protein
LITVIDILLHTGHGSLIMVMVFGSKKQQIILLNDLIENSRLMALTTLFFR